MGIKGDVCGDHAMKPTGLLVIAALSLAGAASAASLADNPPSTRTVCIDPAGKSLPANCRVGQASRLDAREDICLCPAGAERVEAPVCPRGVHEPAESAAYERARREAIHHGTLAGAMYNGRPMCVTARNALNP
jgi:hypothetical protein